jgi:hypothetical protein
VNARHVDVSKRKSSEDKRKKKKEEGYVTRNITFWKM